MEFLSQSYIPAKAIMTSIIAFFGIFYIHKNAYILIGLFFTRKFKKTDKFHKYGIIIPARNEETVIGNLIDSIKNQDYPMEKLTIFVVADNCTDNTAGIARDKGAIVYEHNNPNERTKGFGLRYLFKQIDRDFGYDAFEAYFIFDADNLLKKDYITRMNESFDEGCKIVTSYRNTKNFDENWVASSYALHWLHSIRFRHRARSVLRLATNIQGTGFMFANELMKDGWNYVTLTEDRSFTADAVAKGYQISYNDAAMFYDEQPTSIRISIRQRIRWSKGHLQAFVQTGPLLVYKVFFGNLIEQFGKKKESAKTNLGIKDFNKDIDYGKMSISRILLEEVRVRWAAFDTFAQLFPQVIIKLFMWIFVSIILYSFYSGANGISDVRLFSGKNVIAKNLDILEGGQMVNMAPGIKAAFAIIVLSILWRILQKLSGDLKSVFYGAYLFIVEHKRIKKIPLWKKIVYCFTWTTFDIMYRYSMYAALFMKVEWKVIPHTSSITINDIENGK